MYASQYNIPPNFGFYDSAETESSSLFPYYTQVILFVYPEYSQHVHPLDISHLPAIHPSCAPNTPWTYSTIHPGHTRHASHAFIYSPEIYLHSINHYILLYATAHLKYQKFSNIVSRVTFYHACRAMRAEEKPLDDIDTFIIERLQSRVATVAGPVLPPAPALRWCSRHIATGSAVCQLLVWAVAFCVGVQALGCGSAVSHLWPSSDSRTLIGGP